jgi:uncharacterized membrane protein YhaH (DUF805 family)
VGRRSRKLLEFCVHIKSADSDCIRTNAAAKASSRVYRRLRQLRAFIRDKTSTGLPPQARFHGVSLQFRAMIVALRNLLRCRGSVDRGPYFAAGAVLLVVKILADWSVSRLVFGRSWSPAEYVAPGSSVAMLFSGANERAFYLTMLAIALPFIFLGISLTAMRLRSIGLSAGWTLLFFAPGINLAFFVLLITTPRRREIPPGTVAGLNVASRAAHDGTLPVLSYAGNSGREPWFDRILPVDPRAARALAIFVPVPIATGATFVSIHWFSNYGWGVFVGVPFAIGLMSSVLYAARAPRGLRGCIGIACLSLTAYGVTLLLIAFEGAACLIMAAPLAYPLTILGAAVGASMAGVRPTRLADARRVLLLMLLFLPLFTGAERLTQPQAPIFAVATSVEIQATPARVWANVIGFGEIPPPSDWIFRTGIAYPVRANITGHGVGAIRCCVFSTGPFVEPIRVWNEPNLLKFDVVFNPAPMKEWSPWNDVHPPHLENFLVSQGGQFRLVELPAGRTRLEGTTWYQHHMWPAAYWRLWSDFIIHRIHLRVLNHVKMLSEGRS